MAPKKKIRKGILLRLDVQLLKRIKDFRFEHRFEDRTAAITWLLDFALKTAPKPKPPS
jgi:hypothetical protein